MNTEQKSLKAGVIGYGLIGRAWAIVFAKAGWHVDLFGPSVHRAHEAIEEISIALGNMHAAGLLDEPMDQILGRIRASESLADTCADTCLIQENLPEHVEVKEEIFAKLDALSPAEAVLASSTSWIPASRFTEKLANRQRCLVAHPTNPPNLVPLVEVCPSPWTSKQSVEKAMQLYVELQQQPVLVNQEIDGFLLNRLQGAILNEALNLFEQGVASTADIDKVLKYGLGLRWSFMGPFETIDLNAPRGVVDYAQRYGQTYARVGEEQGPNCWSEELVKKIEQERRTVLQLDELEQRARWRDKRLMALRAHQKNQPN